MLIRVRSNVGIWRVSLKDDIATNELTINDIVKEIEKTKPNVIYERPLCSDPGCTKEYNESQSLRFYQISHGSMIYCLVDPTSVIDTSVVSKKTTEVSSIITTDNDDVKGQQNQNQNQQQQTTHMRRIIDSNGQIKLVPTSDQPRTGEDKGFRQGLKALRDIKMHWTLSDFVAMDAQYEYKIQRQKDAICTQVSLDSNVIVNFQSYLQKFNFQRKRFAYLYGKFVNEHGLTEEEIIEQEKKNNKNTNSNKSTDSDTRQPLRATRVIVEAIYEPPQQIDTSTIEGYVPMDDDDTYGEAVTQISNYLGLTKVGWIYGHETREPGYVMSCSEIIMAAEYQLECANGINDTPFVTIKVTPSLTGQITVEAFQVSNQCMSMVAEEALENNIENPKYCTVNKTFTAIMEGKASPIVENNFFITVVPIIQHTSEYFINDFPIVNRDIDDRSPSIDELRITLSKSNTNGWTIEDRLCDFNLLVYLSQYKYFDLHNDYPKICHSLLNRTTTPLDDGYKILIKSIAGLDSSY